MGGGGIWKSLNLMSDRITCLLESINWVWGAFAKLRKAIISFMSVRPSAWNNSAPTGQIFMKFGIWVFFENLWIKFKFHYNLTRITGTLHEDQYKFFIISRSIHLKMRIFSDKSCRENQNTYFVLRIFFFKSCRLWDNVEKYCRAGQSTDDNMAHAHRMPDT